MATETVAVVVPGPGRSRRRPDRFLAVRRPEDDEDLPGAWGLPATTLRPEEVHAEAVLRVGRDKLGVELEVVRELERGSLERPEGPLRMRLFEARIREGTPTVPQEGGQGTQYVEWRWSGPDRLRESARRGSLCSRLHLGHLDEPWREHR
jgi:ADP-ribose pyrophosphatase YjhB (NUDIX family)